jgi:hypothetical protein
MIHPHQEPRFAMAQGVGLDVPSDATGVLVAHFARDMKRQNGVVGFSKCLIHSLQPLQTDHTAKKIGSDWMGIKAFKVKAQSKIRSS